MKMTQIKILKKRNRWGTFLKMDKKEFSFFGQVMLD